MLQGPATRSGRFPPGRRRRYATSLAGLLGCSLWALSTAAQPGSAQAPAAAPPQSAAPPTGTQTQPADALAPVTPNATRIGSASAESGKAAADDASGTDSQTNTAAQAPPATRLEAEIEFKHLLAEGKYADAAKVGATMLALTEKEYGKKSAEAAAAHAALADAQSRAGDYSAAEQSYLTAVGIYRDVDGLYNKKIIEPLIGLGDNYQRNKQYRDAITAYRQARGVSRREYGLLNAGQVGILDRMTESYSSLNDFENADKQQAAELEIAQRSHKDYEPETLQAMYKYALWLRKTRRFDAEREQYARAERIIRDHFGKESLKLVEPLRRTGESYRVQLNPENAGINALHDALSILQSHPDAPQLRTAEVFRDIGDWQTAFGRGELDNSAYRQAWSLLGGVKGGDALRRQWFSGANYVLRAPIDRRDFSADPDALTGHATIKFDLDRNGRPQNVAVFRSDPPGMEDEVFLRHVEMSRFRPQMMNGAVVPGKRLGLGFTFRYKPDEEKGKHKKGKKRG
jgi:hypothetical protein